MSLSIIVYIIICIIAIIVFLLQQSEKGGMGVIGGYSNTILGTSRMSFMGKVATFLSVLFLCSALFLSIMSSGNKSILKDFDETTTNDEVVEKENVNSLENKSNTNIITSNQ